MEELINVSECDTLIFMSDNLELMLLKLSELVTLVHLIFVVALMIIITLVIYSVFKKFFY